MQWNNGEKTGYTANLFNETQFISTGFNSHYHPFILINFQSVSESEELLTLRGEDSYLLTA